MSFNLTFKLLKYFVITIPTKQFCSTFFILLMTIYAWLLQHDYNNIFATPKKLNKTIIKNAKAIISSDSSTYAIYALKC